MNILIIGSGERADNIKNCLGDAVRKIDVVKQISPDTILAELVNKYPDVVFLALNDSEIATYSLNTLGMMMHKANAQCNIIVIGKRPEDAVEAFKYHASGFILEGECDENRIKYELSDLRNADVRKDFYVKSGAAYCNNKPFFFRYARTGELVRFLYDNNQQMFNCKNLKKKLWGEEMSDSYMNNILSDLKKTFEQNNCYHLIIRKRGFIGINA